MPMRPDEGVVLVKEVNPSYIVLNSPYQYISATHQQCWKQLLSADAFIARLRNQERAREDAILKELEEKEAKAMANATLLPPQDEDNKGNVTGLGGGGNKTDTGDGGDGGKHGGGDGGKKPLTEEEKLKKEQDDLKNQTVCNGTILSGTVAVLHDSAIVTTTADLRPEVADGERVQIMEYQFVVTEGRDQITMTLSDIYPGESAGGLKVCKLDEEVEPECMPLSGCVAVLDGSRVVRTSVDIRDEIDTGEVIKINNKVEARR